MPRRTPDQIARLVSARGDGPVMQVAVYRFDDCGHERAERYMQGEPVPEVRRLHCYTCDHEK